MAISTHDIDTMIRSKFPDAQIRVQSEDGRHFAAEVIDKSFQNMNRVEQQRAVYAALSGAMDGANSELHALALTTRAPEDT